MLRKLFFNLWYFLSPPWDTNQTPPELIEFIENNPPGKALDLGCGTGTNVITLAQHGWQTIGVDFAPKAIRAARKKAAAANVDVDVRVGDVTQLADIQEKFNLILDIGCYHSLTEEGKKDYRANLDRLLTRGGSYLMYCFFKSEQTDSASGLVEADIETLSSQFELVNRADSTERGMRKAAWLTYQKE